MILENLKTAGVQQAHKTDRIDFTSLKPWPGELICAEGRYMEGETERRAGIFIGPEFGTVSRSDLVSATREAADADFAVLIACAFSYEARCTGLDKIGNIQILRARMNADLHMAEDLKNTGKGNLFVIFGEPDIEITKLKNDKYQVKIHGVDVFHPQTGEVRSDGADGIACWFIDTNYNEEAFFVRHAYFLGANDPYSALKTTLKAEINEEAWATLHSDTSREFGKPTIRSNTPTHSAASALSPTWRSWNARLNIPGRNGLYFCTQLTERSESRDYLILASDLIFSNAPVLPKSGDRIRETQNAKVFVYEVMAPNNEPHYRFSDAYRKTLRIHTKLISTEDAP